MSVLSDKIQELQGKVVSCEAAVTAIVADVAALKAAGGVTQSDLDTLTTIEGQIDAMSASLTAGL